MKNYPVGKESNDVGQKLQYTCAPATKSIIFITC